MHASEVTSKDRLAFEFTEVIFDVCCDLPKICDDPIPFVSLLPASTISVLKIVHAHSQNAIHGGLHGGKGTSWHHF